MLAQANIGFLIAEMMLEVAKVVGFGDKVFSDLVNAVEL
jgi:hypothetical protein